MQTPADVPQRLIRLFFTPKERSPCSLDQELRLAAVSLRSTVTTPLKQYQADALLSLLADLAGHHASGKTTWEASPLLKAINARQFNLAAAEFFAFSLRCGSVQRRLWEKRNCEQLLFRRGTLVLPS